MYLFGYHLSVTEGNHHYLFVSFSSSKCVLFMQCKEVIGILDFNVYFINLFPFILILFKQFCGIYRGLLWV